MIQAEPAAAAARHGEETAYRRRRAELVYVALGQLPEQERAVLMTTHVHGLPLGAAAAELGLPVPLVRRSLFRGLRQLESLVAAQLDSAGPLMR